MLIPLAPVPALLVSDADDVITDCRGGCPRNVLLIARDEGLGDAALALGSALTLGLCLVAVGMLVRQWRAAAAPERRSLVPLFVSGGVTLALVAAYAVSQVDALLWMAFAAFAATPFAFLAGLARADLSGSRGVRTLMAELADAPERADLRDALARALGDPALELAFWMPELDRYVDAGGSPAELPGEDDARRTVTEIDHHGERVAAIVHDRAQDTETVRAAGAATALMLENQRLDAELRARLVELRASRARLVEAADGERRRLERDLHDGAQSRLVALALNLRLARMSVTDGSDTAALLDGSIDELGAEPQGAARSRPRHPSGRALRARARAGGARARRARSRPGRHRRSRRRSPPRRGRDRGLLRGLRGAHQRVEVRARRARDGAGRARRRTAAGGGERRRRGRRQRQRRLRASRPVRPRRSAQRHARGLEPSRPGHAAASTPALHVSAAADRSLRVVVAEDSFLLRAGVVRVLEDAGFVVVGEARDAEELLDQVREHRPDVVVTDIRMPPTQTDEGVRAAAVIRSELPQTGVVVLSQYVNESYAIQLLEESAAGVGYLLKDRVMEPRGFAEAVRQVARGGSALDPEVVAQMLERRRRGGPLDELSERELDVLAGMAEGRSNLAIATDLGISEHALQRDVASIFSKLDLPVGAEGHRRVLAVLTYIRAQES